MVGHSFVYGRYSLAIFMFLRTTILQLHHLCMWSSGTGVLIQQ